jgi:hypothetical protein
MDDETISIEHSTTYTNVTSVWKFILLSTFTFHIYDAIWFYRSWKFIKSRNENDISPFWRSILSPLFTESLAAHQQKLLTESNIKFNYSTVLIGISYFYLNLLGNLTEPYSLLSTFSFIPILPMVIKMNNYYQMNEVNTIRRPLHFGKILLVGIGILLKILVILGSFISESETTSWLD